MPGQETPFGWKDALLISLIFAFGGLGYLCDIHSPLALPAIPFFGAFFLSSLLALGGLCGYQFISRTSPGWLIGLALAATLIGGALWLVLGSH